MDEKREQSFRLARNIQSRFVNLTVEAGKDGKPRLVLEGPYMEIAGFEVGESVDAIIQKGLISLLRLD